MEGRLGGPGQSALISKRAPYLGVGITQGDVLENEVTSEKVEGTQLPLLSAA